MPCNWPRCRGDAVVRITVQRPGRGEVARDFCAADAWGVIVAARREHALFVLEAAGGDPFGFRHFAGCRDYVTETPRRSLAQARTDVSRIDGIHCSLTHLPIRAHNRRAAQKLRAALGEPT